MTTPICSIGVSGISRPDFPTVLAYFVNGYQGIYGSDTYVASDSQDGELLGLLASAVDDTNAQTVSVFNAYSPSTAQGTGLSSAVKLNGLARDVPSFSTIQLAVIGQALTTVTNGIATDPLGNPWSLPASVQIPFSGTVTVTATCQTLGAILIAAATPFTITTQTLGWQAATSVAASVPGQPVETDNILRQRQSLSTSQAAQGPMASMKGAVLALPSVIACQGYENDTDLPDDNGIPGHCVSLIVTGGTPSAIANAVLTSKQPGVSTFGTTTATAVDQYGISHTIAWFAPTIVPVFWFVQLRPLTGYTADVATAIQASLSAWTNGLGVGQDVLLNRANVPANLNLGPLSSTYEIVSLQASQASQTASTNDIVIAFNAQAAAPIVTNPDGSLSYPNVRIRTVLTG